MNRRQSKIAALSLMALMVISGWIVAFLMMGYFDTLKVHNPYHVWGYASAHAYNPFSDVLKFVVLLLMPAVLCVVYGQLTKKCGHLWPAASKPETGARVSLTSAEKVALVLLVLLLIFNIRHYEYHNYSFDPFHEGEFLSCTINHLHGAVPYRDNIVVLGLFEDIYKVNAGFALWGKSIGASRSMESLLMMLDYLLLFLLMYYLFGRDLLYAVLVFAGYSFMTSGAWTSRMYFNPLLIRESILFALVFVQIKLKKKIEAGAGRHSVFLWSMLWAFIPVWAFMVSIDRAYIALTAFGVFGLLMGADAYRRGHLAVLAGGALSGMVVALLLLRYVMGDGWQAFLHYTFVDVPRFKDLYDGLPFPFRRVEYVFIPLVMSIGAMGYVVLWWQHKARGGKLQGLLNSYYDELLMYVLALMVFRVALGRSDAAHLLYSTTFFVLWLAMVLRRSVWQTRSRESAHLMVKVAKVTSGLVLIFLLFHTDYREQLEVRFPVGRSDSSFLDEATRYNLQILKASIKAEDKLVVLTDMPAYSYLLDKPSPLRFNFPYIITTDYYRREAVSQWAKQEVEWVLTLEQAGDATVDEVKVSERYPELYDYLYRHYRLWKRLRGVALWRRRR